MFRFTNPAAWSFHRSGCHAGGFPRRGTNAGFPMTLPAIPGSQGPALGWKEYHHVPLVELPETDPASTTLGEALAQRLSCRQFGGPRLGTDDVSGLLRASYGVKDQVRLQGMVFSERPVPSGGACFPIELYLLVRQVEGIGPGVYHYGARRHRLEQLRGPLPWNLLAGLFMDQPYLLRADMIIVLTAVVHRTLLRYGDRGFRFIWIEAGHVAQNLNLVGAAMGLGTLDLGGFFDDPLAALLGLDPEAEIPLYGVAVGRPSTGDREAVRNPDQP
ncbi:MAG: SagB/ThcOx family dehydrogenase [bacterium]|nr:SagB/ThcOx family dehydrogenase [bacterium]